jgi:uncharacterized protein (DUF2336 family)
MSASRPLIPELEHIVQNGSPRKRVQALERITALFLDGASRFNEDHVRLFDDVLVRLTDEIELKARAELARRLAPVGNAPTEVVGRLAKDADILVAGPVLQQSNRLAESDLVEIAETGSQAHLLAISNRAGIAERVTDVLVRRGDPAVVRSVAKNRHARLSAGGLRLLVNQAAKDEALAETVGRRPDLPPALFRELVLKAGALVQQWLLVSAKPEIQAEIRSMLAGAPNEVRSTIAPRDYHEAERAVAALRREGRLDEAQLLVFAKAGRYEELIVALAELCAVPLDVVERLMSGERPDPILILCKSMDWGWPTARAIAGARPDRGGDSSQGLDAARANFERLAVGTASRVTRFWRMRPDSADPSANDLAIALSDSI